MKYAIMPILEQVKELVEDTTLTEEEFEIQSAQLVRDLYEANQTKEISVSHLQEHGL